MPHQHLPVRARRAIAATVAVVAAATTVGQFTRADATTTADVTTTVPQPAVAAASTGMSLLSADIIFGGEARRNQELDRVAASGATWIRLDVAGTQILNSTWQNWSGLDAAIAGAQARGLKVLGILSTLGDYQRPSGSSYNYGPTTDRDRANFADFARMAATRYKGKVAAWEIWNEPNLHGYWAPTPSAADYTKLLKAVYPVLKSVDPSVKVVTGGTGGYSAAPDIKATDWMQALYDNGARPYFDAMGVHGYTAPWQTPVSLGEMKIPNLLRYRAILDRNGDSGKQLWLTETGTCTNTTRCATESEAVTFTKQSVANWMTIPNHGPMFMFTMRDTTTGHNGASANLGFFRSDGSQKPTYAALQSMLKG